MILDWNLISSVIGNQSDKLRCHVIVDSIASTNDWPVWSCGNDQLPAVCLAEQQSSGRGRRGRKWVSSPFENIYFSLVWPFSADMKYGLEGISLVAGIVIARVMAGLDINAGVKWPNDVVVNNNKIAGILVETRFKKSGGAVVVIGVGINYLLSEESRLNIGQACSDIASHFGNQLLPDRNIVAGMAIKELILACEEFACYGFQAFVEEWGKYDICSGRDVQVNDVSGTWDGKVIGISSKCGLRVLRDNTECVVYAADVSLRIK